MGHVSTLQSWKEIAGYLGRAVRTVQRWEALGLPIHRPQVFSRKGAVYAVTHELDTWLLNNPQDETSNPSTNDGTNGHAGCPVALRPVLITDQLAQRPFGLSDEKGRLAALRMLGEKITKPPETLLTVLIHQALTLCGAESAGLSLLHEEDRRQFFHWDALAGLLKDCGGQTTPRGLSPCGVTLDRRSPQLFSYPERYFDCLKSTPYPLVEVLVVPCPSGRRGIGNHLDCLASRGPQFQQPACRNNDEPGIAL